MAPRAVVAQSGTSPDCYSGGLRFESARRRSPHTLGTFLAHNGPREATFRGMCPLTPGPLGPALSLFSETPNAESPFCSDYGVALVPSMPASVGGPFPSGKPTTY